MKTINICLTDDIFYLLCKQSKSYGLSRSAYISFCLKQKSEQDELIKSLPVITKAIEDKMSDK